MGLGRHTENSERLWRMKPVQICVPVWGKDYIETYLRWSLPAQIAGLRQLEPGRGLKYSIYTDYPHLIRGSHLIGQLDQLGSVEIFTFHGPKINKYATKSAIYRDHLSRAAGSINFLLNADIVLAEEFIPTAVEKIEAGAKVIQVVAPRGKRDEMGWELDDARPRSSLALAKLWLANMHPSLEMHMVDGDPRGPFHPSHLYWYVGTEGIVARCFHYYPIVVCLDKAPDFRGTIDDDLVAAAHVGTDEIHFANDSRDGLFCCELSPPGNPMVRICARGDRVKQFEFYRSYADGRDLWYLAQEVLITSTENLSSDWPSVRDRAYAHVMQIGNAHDRKL